MIASFEIGGQGLGKGWSFDGRDWGRELVVWLGLLIGLFGLLFVAFLGFILVGGLSLRSFFILDFVVDVLLFLVGSCSRLRISIFLMHCEGI